MIKYPKISIIREKMSGFTLAEVLITLGIIGVVAALTISPLIQKVQEHQWVSGLLEFNSLIQQSVKSWRGTVNCNDLMYQCLGASLTSPNDGARYNIVDSSLDDVVAGLKVAKIACPSGCSETVSQATWLPSQTLLYNGADQNTCSYSCSTGGVSKQSSSLRVYLLPNGMTFSMGYEEWQGTGFIHLFVDVNGAKLPNRFGKDTFTFTIGELPDVFARPGTAADVIPYPRGSSGHACDGLCGPYDGVCNPNNVDPTKDSGASATANAILNKKIADFKALSATIGGFKP